MNISLYDIVILLQKTWLFQEQMCSNYLQAPTFNSHFLALLAIAAKPSCGDVFRRDVRPFTVTQVKSFGTHSDNHCVFTVITLRIHCVYSAYSLCIRNEYLCEHPWEPSL